VSPHFLTRKRIVDQRLRAAGWTLLGFKPGLPLTGYESWGTEEYPIGFNGSQRRLPVLQLASIPLTRSRA
jgi:hypothetical protein